MSTLPAVYDPDVGEDIDSTLPGDGDVPDDEANEIAAEERALRMGWVPFNQFRGDPSQWRKASEWLQRADEMLPIARSLNHSLETKLARQETTIAEMRRSMDEQTAVIQSLRALAKRADEAGYQRALAEIRAEKKQAVAAGDTEAYEQAEEREIALVDARAEIEREELPARTTTQAKPEPEADKAPKLSIAVQDFLRDNRWFGADKFLADKMVGYHKAVIVEDEIADEGEQLAEAKRRLIAKYPNEFAKHGIRAQQPQPPANRERRRAPDVASPTGAQGGRPREDGRLTFAMITDPKERAEAKAEFDRMARTIPNYSDQEFLAVFLNPHADVLTVQEEARRQRNGK